MPKNKSKRQGAKAATGAAAATDDAFDKMLSELTAQDAQLPTDIRASTARTTNTASSSSSSVSGEQEVSSPELQVSENAIVAACKRGDITQLRRWGRQGVRVKSADLLIDCIIAEVSLDILRCLVKELGADINGARLRDGRTPLYVAAQNGNLALLQCLVKELGADVNQAADDGYTPLHIAAQQGHLNVVRCLVKKCGADINEAKHNGVTPLMIAANCKHEDVVTFLIKYGANVKDSTDAYGTAANISKEYAAPSKQTKYLEARTHCTMPGCDGIGAKKCAGCLKVYYCTRECQLANWSAHKAECRRSADKTTAKRPEECQP
jgi:hypothetical protein